VKRVAHGLTDADCRETTFEDRDPMSQDPFALSTDASALTKPRAEKVVAGPRAATCCTEPAGKDRFVLRTPRTQADDDRPARHDASREQHSRERDTSDGSEV